MVAKELFKIKEQSKVVMREAKKCASLFDKAFRLAIYQEFKNGKVISTPSGKRQLLDLAQVDVGSDLYLPTKTGGDIHYSRTDNEDGDTLNYNALFSNDSILARHEHDCIEVVYVEQGSFSVLLGRERDGTIKTVSLEQGEILDIPANLPHQFTNTYNGETKVKIKYLRP